jgi:hypothetical protein
MRYSKLPFASLIFIILISPLNTGKAQGSEPPHIEPSVNINFGESIEFSAVIESNVDPVRAALFIRASTDVPFSAHIVDIAPGLPKRASIQFNPQAINMRPFALVEYFWQIDFADGTTITMEPLQVSYHDARYSWQKLHREDADVYWIEGDLEWAQDIYAIAKSGLPEIERTLAKTISTTIQIYVYPSQSGLQNSLRLAGINQASAHTLPELGVVLIAGKSGPETLIRFEKEIPHELVHLMLYDRMGSAINNLPAWLDEGLATFFEQAPRQVYSSTLQQAVDNGALIEMETLCAGFPISESDRILAYAQSASFITYLIDVYGTGGINQLLDAYTEGTTCTGGIQRVYQRSLSQLESEWKRVSLDEAGSPNKIKWLTYILAVAVLVFAVMSTYWVFSHKRRSTGEQSES